MRNKSGATMLTVSPAGSGNVEARLDAVKGNAVTEKASATVPVAKLVAWFEKVTGLDLMLGQKFSVKEAAPLGRIRIVTPWKNAAEVEWALIKAFAKVPTAQRDEGGNAYFDFPGDPRIARKITPLVKRVGGQVMHLDEHLNPTSISTSLDHLDALDAENTGNTGVYESGPVAQAQFERLVSDQAVTMLAEGIEAFRGDPRYEDPEPGSAADHLAAMLAVGPYKHEPTVWECPKCGGHNGRVREAHADTGMDCQEFRCPDCKHSTEDLETVAKVSPGRVIDTRTGQEVRPFDGKVTRCQIAEAALTAVNPFMMPWPVVASNPEAERILRRLRAALGAPARVREGLDESWKDDAGRLWTDEEMDVLYRFKSPSYIIDRDVWQQRHFTRVTEGFTLIAESELHPVRVDDEIGTRRRVDASGFWGEGKYETETLVKRRVYNRGKPTEYVVQETQRLVWNEHDDSPALKEDGSQYGFPQRIAWTPTGLYIGDPRTARFLCTKRGIKPELASESHNVCSVGFAAEEKKWFGWSHRAIAGFGVGDRIFEEGFGTDSTPFSQHGSKPVKNMRDARLAAVAFAAYVS